MGLGHPLQPVDRARAHEALASRAAQGDAEAAGQLLEQLAPLMLRTARALLGTTHLDLDDVVQQSLIAVVQSLPAFRGDCSVAHFAARITTRIAVAARRRAFSRSDRNDDSVELDALYAAPLAEPVDAERRRALVRSLLETLPEEQAETLALRIVLGFSLEEVAQATGVPVNTVRSRVRLAKAALLKRIEADPRLAEALEVES